MHDAGVNGAGFSPGNLHYHYEILLALWGHPQAAKMLSCIENGVSVF